MGLFSRPKPVQEMHRALDELLAAEKEYQRAVSSSGTDRERRVQQASHRLMGAQWGHRVASSRNDDQYWTK